jgi:hypothetical protein
LRIAAGDLLQGVGKGLDEKTGFNAKIRVCRKTFKAQKIV